MNKTKTLLSVAFGTVVAISAIIKISDAISNISSGKNAKEKDPYSVVMENISKVAKLNSVVYLDEFVLTCARYEKKENIEETIKDKENKNHIWSLWGKKSEDTNTLGEQSETPRTKTVRIKVDTVCFVSFDPKEEKLEMPSGLSDDWKEKEQYCYIMNSTIRAGIDLSKISKDDIISDKDTLYIAIPEAEIFGVIINPKDYRIFAGNPSWKDEQTIFTNVKERCKNDAIEDGLLDSAQKMGEEQLTNLFLSLGFKKVVLQHKNEKGQIGLPLPNNG